MLDKELQENAISPENLDENMNGFVNEVTQYYTNIAKNEGYINDGDDIDFKVIFVPED